MLTTERGNDFFKSPEVADKSDKVPTIHSDTWSLGAMIFDLYFTTKLKIIKNYNEYSYENICK